MNRYEKWLGKRTVNQNTIETFVEELNAKGNSTKLVIAALKYKYVRMMKMPLDFKDLAEESKHKKPHIAVSGDDRQCLDDLLKKPRDLKWRVACRLLYDLGFRS